MLPALNLLPYQHAAIDAIIAGMSARRHGKTIIIDSLTQMAQGMRRMQSAAQNTTYAYTIFDEAWRLDTKPLLDDEREVQRAAWHRDGRYRKPPVASKEKPPASGMVQVRDRAGKLVWKKMGGGMERVRLQDNPLFGAF
jgi:hypothetical protein